jgi:hypothetical protein
MKYWALILLLVALSCVSISPQKTAPPNNQVSLQLTSWRATIDLTTLRIHAWQDHKPPLLLVSGYEHARPVSKVALGAQRISFTQGVLDFSIFARNDRLHLRVSSQTTGEFTLAALGADAQVKAIILPEGEGLYVPNEDHFWQQQLGGHAMVTHGQDDLVAPFWGYELPDRTVSFIAHTDLSNHLTFDIRQGRLINKFSHYFDTQNQLAPLELSISLTPKTPLAPALNFRQYLIENGEFVSLADKIKKNPAIKKLAGAMHAYMWGDGRTPQALLHLKKLGIEHMWLGYEDKPRKIPQGKWVKPQHYVDTKFIEEAKALGFLVGPYDSFHTMAAAEKAESANTYFGHHYPDACIRLKNGALQKGFANIGCHASSQALAFHQTGHNILKERIEAFVSTGINSYFLDCDATGELFNDYSLEHPMNQAEDQKNRLERMGYIANTKNLVLGSETAAAWAVPVLAFAHGNFSVRNRVQFRLMKDKMLFGRWWPPERPSIFFQTFTPPPDFVKAKFDPRYRLPLFQAAFHDAIVVTDRWELSHNKMPALTARRELLELLYGVPSIWALDQKAIKQQSAHLKKLGNFFAIFHPSIFLLPLSEFSWLSEDKMLQQTIFGHNEVLVIANFSAETRQEIPAFSVRVTWAEQNKSVIYTP